MIATSAKREEERPRRLREQTRGHDRPEGVDVNKRSKSRRQARIVKRSRTTHRGSASTNRYSGWFQLPPSSVPRIDTIRLTVNEPWDVASVYVPPLKRDSWWRRAWDALYDFVADMTAVR